jgi:hypothetical protein
MNRDLAVIFFSSVVATFNPTLLAAVTVMLLLPHPQRLMLGYLAGAYTTSIAAGVAIVFALHQSGAIETSQHTASPAADIAIGAIALTIALRLALRRDGPLQRWRKRRKAPRTSEGQSTQPWQQRMLGRGSAGVTFLVGAVVSFPGFSYINALDHIVALNPPAVPILLLILYFCVMQQILLELPLLCCILAPDWTQGVVVGFRAWLGRNGRRIGVIALAGLGLYLALHGLPTIS